MKTAYSELFDRNEYAYELSREKLIGQVVEITGETKDNRVTQGIAGTFLALNDLADFDAKETEKSDPERKSEENLSTNVPSNAPTSSQIEGKDNIELRVGYTINLNLPETNDPEVFSAIFKALRENLLKS